MKRRIFCAVMTVVLVLTMLPVIAAAEGAVEIAFTQRETKAGATRVQVGVAMSNNPGLVTATIPVTWDNDVLHLVNVIPSEDILSAGWIGMGMDEYQSNGTYYLAWDNDLAEADFTTEVGCLAELVFDIVDPSRDTETTLAFDMDDPIANVMNFAMEDLRETVTVNAANGTVSVAAEAGGDDPVVESRFYIEDVESLKGKNVDVNLVVENNPGIAGATIDVTFDSSVMTLNTVTEGDAFGKLTLSKKISAGSARISFLNMSDDQNDESNGVIAVLNFTVAENVEDGEYAINISINSTSDASYNAVEMGADNGKLTVFSYVPGDATGDNVIDIRDAVMLMQIVNGYDVAAADETVMLALNVTGDFDSDGNPVIDIRDAVMLMQYVNGYDVEFKN